ncbi:hypothetical protein [Amycolatopsis tolypomycina]|uniref:Shikimate kinase n=1 Tax=Amycolatopsis tolypomycina TaxID=208445 RepID=A0A1H4J2T5_9PSEU|nr:hypothetical protein [Amycolatopsis tolypomycina]SEB40630.1 hypothetical protein SAMN04489727_1461 [Amycolatopsis tolypomycina]
MWDPTGSIGRALWIGGAQWAGKSTVARLLALRHGLTAYHYDFHDARAHNDRLLAGGAPARDPERLWVRSTPAEMAAATREVFALRFEWALDDLRALVSGRPIIAEGWGLRPEFVAPLLDSPRRMVVMVPTEEFRQHQLATLPRAGMISPRVSDPVRAQQNRIARDRLLAEDAVRSAREHGIRVLEIDGTTDAEEVADTVAGHFGLD